MKKLRILALGLLLLLVLCACGEPTGTAPGGSDKYPYNYADPRFFNIENCLKYAPMAKLEGVQGNMVPFDIKSTKDGYTVAQGAASDGTYGYFIQAKPSANINGVTKEACKIIKVDMRTWQIVKESEPLEVCHGNGMGYNSKTHKLVVAHNKPEFKNISVVDPETLQVERVVTINRDIQSIAYNEKRDQYVVRMSGKWEFAILDADFNEVSYHETGVKTPLGSQCMTCDDDYIYMLDSGVTKMPGFECITVYTWEGKYLGVYRVPSMQETEAIILFGDEYYLTFFNGSGTRVYKLIMDKSLLAK